MATPTVIRTALSRGGKMGMVITYTDRQGPSAVFQVYTPAGAEAYQLCLEHSSPWDSEAGACGEWAEWVLRNQDDAEVS